MEDTEFYKAMQNIQASKAPRSSRAQWQLNLFRPGLTENAVAHWALQQQWRWQNTDNKSKWLCLTTRRKTQFIIMIVVIVAAGKPDLQRVMKTV